MEDKFGPFNDQEVILKNKPIEYYSIFKNCPIFTSNITIFYECLLLIEYSIR